jgi:hypothetical protein
MNKLKSIQLLFTVLSFLAVNTCLAQDSNSKSESHSQVENTLGDKKIVPIVILGELGTNKATNNIEASVAEQKLKIQFTKALKNYNGVWAFDVSGKDENQSFSILSGTKISPKLAGNLSYTWEYRNPIVKYNISGDADLKKSLDSLDKRIANKEASITRYKFLRNNGFKYTGVKKNTYSFLTPGVELSGAKYVLVDSSVRVDSMISKKQFVGPKFYLQWNHLRYNFNSNRSTIHSIRTSVGKVNNISDLTEYAIRSGITYNSPTNAVSVEKEQTGYYANKYAINNSLDLGYEVSNYSLDSTKIKLGYIMGAKYTHNIDDNKGIFRIDGGLTIPAILAKKRVYLALVVSSLDPTNEMLVNNFVFEKSLTINLKIGTGLRINYKNR